MALDVMRTSRLRTGGRVLVLVLCLVSIGVSARQTIWYWSHGPAVSDFRIFMTGIEMVRSGEGRNLYRFDAQERMQTRLYPETKVSGLLPFNHPAFELLFYWPLSWLPYRAGILVWAAINIGIVFLVARLLVPYTLALRPAMKIPLPLVLLAFYPVVLTLGERQDSLILLLLLCASLRAFDANRSFLAGIAIGFACYKPHLALTIAIFVLLLTRTWKGLAGFAVICAAMGGFSFAMVGPHMVSDYLAMLRKQGELVPWGFIPWFMPNLRGLFQSWLVAWLDLGQIGVVIFMSSVIVGVLAGWIVLRARGRDDARLVYSVAILTTILISYHFHMQDLTVAVLPMLVLLERWIQRRIASRQGTGEGGAERQSVAKGHFEDGIGERINRIGPRVGPSASGAWEAVLVVAVVSIYGYRIAAEASSTLLMYGCVLCVPVLLLWLVSLRTICAADQ